MLHNQYLNVSFENRVPLALLTGSGVIQRHKNLKLSGSGVIQKT